MEPNFLPEKITPEGTEKITQWVIWILGGIALIALVGTIALALFNVQVPDSIAVLAGIVVGALARSIGAGETKQ